jgi:hypothetical protein
MDSVVTINEFDNRNTEFRQRMLEATSGLTNRYYIIMAERMSVHNADILAKFIIYNRKQRNIALNTLVIYIAGISYLENFHKNKNLDEMSRDDIISFLDSYRKSENIDPLHRWINTYNTRLTALYKFFKWLYSPKFDGTVASALETTTPPIISGITLSEPSQDQIKCDDDNKQLCYLTLSTMKKDPQYRILGIHETEPVKSDSILAKYSGGADFYSRC